MKERKMNDREMLLFCYGALKADKYNKENEVVRILEQYLYPSPQVVFKSITEDQLNRELDKVVE